MKNVRTGRAAKQDVVFTYTPPHDASPKALTPAEEPPLRRIEAARTSDVGIAPR
jgi:hypothetical protein